MWWPPSFPKWVAEQGSEGLGDKEAIVGTSVTWPGLYDIGLLLVGIAVASGLGLLVFFVGMVFGPQEGDNGSE